MMNGRTTDLLADTFGYAHAVLFGRARSAVAALVREVGEAGLPVIVPSNICPEVCLAVEAASAMPCLASVSSLNGLPPDRRMLQHLEGRRPGILMPAHLYGVVQDYSNSVEASRQRGWFVLENDTLAATARLTKNAPRRAFGDALLISFGSSKTISLGGGGALLTDDVHLAMNLQRQLRGAMPFDQGQIEADQKATNRRRADRLSPIAPEASAGQLWAFPDDLHGPLQGALQSLPRTVERLQNQHESWTDGLHRAGLAPTAQPRTPWRWITTIAQGRDEVASALRAAGFDAGINFPPVWNRSLRWLRDANHEDAESFGRSVLNLWLSEADDPERIRAAASVIEEALDAIKRLSP